MNKHLKNIFLVISTLLTISIIAPLAAADIWYVDAGEGQIIHPFKPHGCFNCRATQSL